MKHALAIGIGVATLAALPAFAADIPVRIPTKAPVMVAPVSNWSGCYIGANAGATWGRSDTTWTGITESPTGFAAGAATVIPAAANARFGNTGFVGGGQIGCNYQNGSLVLGVEADAQYTGLNVTRTAVSLGDTNGGPPTITPGNITENFQSRWLSTARARAGFAAGPWLFYATGGLAVANVKFFDQICAPTAAIPGCATASIGTTRLGWTVGGGIEWMFASNWTAKAEYLYVDLGSAASVSQYTPTAGGVNPFTAAFITHNHRFTENIVRVGLNYKFDTGAVVARY